MCGVVAPLGDLYTSLLITCRANHMVLLLPPYPQPAHAVLQDVGTLASYYPPDQLRRSETRDMVGLRHFVVVRVVVASVIGSTPVRVADVAVEGKPVLARPAPTGLVTRPRYERLPAHPVAAHPRLLRVSHCVCHLLFRRSTPPTNGRLPHAWRPSPVVHHAATYTTEPVELVREIRMILYAIDVISNQVTAFQLHSPQSQLVVVGVSVVPVPFGCLR